MHRSSSFTNCFSRTLPMTGPDYDYMQYHLYRYNGVLRQSGKTKIEYGCTFRSPEPNWPVSHSKYPSVGSATVIVILSLLSIDSLVSLARALFVIFLHLLFPSCANPNLSTHHQISDISISPPPLRPHQPLSCFPVTIATSCIHTHLHNNLIWVI